MASYISINDADNLIRELYLSSSDEYKLWDDLSTEDRQVLLNKYSMYLVGEDVFMWRGKKVDPAQELDFPRLYNKNTLVFNKMMSIGLITMMLSNEKSINSEFGKLRSENIKSFSDGGGMRVDFSTDSTVSSTLINNCGGCCIGGVPAEIFNKYFRSATYLV